jgi:hypothetical protein
MDFENLVIACLIFEKSGFHLDIKKTFFNVQIDEALREEKDEILKKFQKIKETEKMVDVLALHFYLKIYVKKKENVYISSDYGPEFFIHENIHGTCFHSNPGKILRLPAGLNCCKGSKFRYSDFFQFEDVKEILWDNEFTKAFETSFLYCDQMDNIESSTGLGLEIWKNTMINGKPSLEKMRSTNKTPKKMFFLDECFNILFLITNPKLFFRGRTNYKK